MLQVFCSPSRYTQGKNATAQLGEEIRKLGLEGPALIIAGRSAVSLLSAVWKTSLGNAGIAYTVLPFGGECSASEIERARSLLTNDINRGAVCACRDRRRCGCRLRVG